MDNLNCKEPNHQTLTEAEFKAKPSKKDYREAEILFDDFGIKKEIPEFDTVIELQRFTKSEIDKFLNKGE